MLVLLSGNLALFLFVLADKSIVIKLAWLALVVTAGAWSTRARIRRRRAQLAEKG